MLSGSPSHPLRVLRSKRSDVGRYHAPELRRTNTPSDLSGVHPHETSTTAAPATPPGIQTPRNINLSLVVTVSGWRQPIESHLVVRVEITDPVSGNDLTGELADVYVPDTFSADGRIPVNILVRTQKSVSPDAVIMVSLFGAFSAEGGSAHEIRQLPSGLRASTGDNRRIGTSTVFLRALADHFISSPDAGPVTKTMMAAGVGECCEDRVYGYEHARAFVQYTNVQVTDNLWGGPSFDYIPFTEERIRRGAEATRALESMMTNSMANSVASAFTPRASEMVPLPFYVNGVIAPASLLFLPDAPLPTSSRDTYESAITPLLHSALVHRELKEHTLRDAIRNDELVLQDMVGEDGQSKDFTMVIRPFATEAIKAWVLEQLLTPETMPVQWYADLELLRMQFNMYNYGVAAIAKDSANLLMLMFSSALKYVDYRGDNVIVLKTRDTRWGGTFSTDKWDASNTPVDMRWAAAANTHGLVTPVLVPTEDFGDTNALQNESPAADCEDGATQIYANITRFRDTQFVYATPLLEAMRILSKTFHHAVTLTVTAWDQSRIPPPSSFDSKGADCPANTDNLAGHMIAALVPFHYLDTCDMLGRNYRGPDSNTREDKTPPTPAVSKENTMVAAMALHDTFARNTYDRWAVDTRTPSPIPPFLPISVIYQLDTIVRPARVGTIMGEATAFGDGLLREDPATQALATLDKCISARFPERNLESSGLGYANRMTYGPAPGQRREYGFYDSAVTMAGDSLMARGVGRVKILSGPEEELSVPILSVFMDEVEWAARNTFVVPIENIPAVAAKGEVLALESTTDGPLTVKELLSLINFMPSRTDGPFDGVDTPLAPAPPAQAVTQSDPYTIAGSIVSMVASERPGMMMPFSKEYADQEGATAVVFHYRRDKITQEWANLVAETLRYLDCIAWMSAYEERLSSNITGVVLVVYVITPFSIA